MSVASGGDEIPSSAQEAVQQGLAALQTTTSYYAAMALLHALSDSSSNSNDGRVPAQDVHACIERVRLLLSRSARCSSLGGELVGQFLEDVEAVYGPVMKQQTGGCGCRGARGRVFLDAHHWREVAALSDSAVETFQCKAVDPDGVDRATNGFDGV